MKRHRSNTPPENRKLSEFQITQNDKPGLEPKQKAQREKEKRGRFVKVIRNGLTMLILKNN